MIQQRSPNGTFGTLIRFLSSHSKLLNIRGLVEAIGRETATAFQLLFNSRTVGKICTTAAHVQRKASLLTTQATSARLPLASSTSMSDWTVRPAMPRLGLVESRVMRPALAK